MKTTFLSVIFGLLFISCSRDSDDMVGNKLKGDSKIEREDSKTLEKEVLVTKIIREREGRSKTSITYSYDGDKLKDIEDKDDAGEYSLKTSYQYNGDLIKSSIAVDIKGNTKEVEYIYNSDKQLEKSVSTIKIISEPSQVTTETKSYTYKENGVVEVSAESIRKLQDGKTQKNSRVYTYTLVDGLVTRLVDKNIAGREQVKIFEYDTKNSPLMNIRGISALAIEFFNEGVTTIGSFKNNMRTYTIQLNQKEVYKKNIEYEYTSHNFPAKITSKTSSKETDTFILTYNK